MTKDKDIRLTKDQLLLEAARVGDTQQLKQILDRLQHQKHRRKSNPLSSFATKQNSNATRVNNVRDPITGFGCLHHAALGGHSTCVRLIISISHSAINPNIVDYKGATPLHLAAWAGHAQVVRELLSFGCSSSPAAASNINNDSPRSSLNSPSSSNNVVRHSLDVNIRNNDGHTPLALAAQFGHADVVALLLAAGASVSLRNTRLESALELASLYNRVQVVELLLAASGDELVGELRKQAALVALSELEDVCPFNSYSQLACTSRQDSVVVYGDADGEGDVCGTKGSFQGQSLDHGGTLRRTKATLASMLTRKQTTQNDELSPLKRRLSSLRSSLRNSQAYASIHETNTNDNQARDLEHEQSKQRDNDAQQLKLLDHSALHYAMQNGCVDVAELLLFKFGANVCQVTRLGSVLHQIALNNGKHLEMVELVFDYVASFANKTTTTPTTTNNDNKLNDVHQQRLDLLRSLIDLRDFNQRTVIQLLSQINNRTAFEIRARILQLADNIQRRNQAAIAQYPAPQLLMALNCTLRRPRQLANYPVNTFAASAGTHERSVSATMDDVTSVASSSAMSHYDNSFALNKLPQAQTQTQTQLAVSSRLSLNNAPSAASYQTTLQAQQQMLRNSQQRLVAQQQQLATQRHYMSQQNVYELAQAHSYLQQSNETLTTNFGTCTSATTTTTRPISNQLMRSQTDCSSSSSISNNSQDNQHNSLVSCQPQSHFRSTHNYRATHAANSSLNTRSQLAAYYPNNVSMHTNQSFADINSALAAQHHRNNQIITHQQRARFVQRHNARRPNDLQQRQIPSNELISRFEESKAHFERDFNKMINVELLSKACPTIQMPSSSSQNSNTASMRQPNQLLTSVSLDMDTQGERLTISGTLTQHNKQQPDDSVADIQTGSDITLKRRSEPSDASKKLQRCASNSNALASSFSINNSSQLHQATLPKPPKPSKRQQQQERLEPQTGSNLLMLATNNNTTKSKVISADDDTKNLADQVTIDTDSGVCTSNSPASLSHESNFSNSSSSRPTQLLLRNLAAITLSPPPSPSSAQRDLEATFETISNLRNNLNTYTQLSDNDDESQVISDNDDLFCPNNYSEPLCTLLQLHDNISPPLSSSAQALNETNSLPVQVEHDVNDASVDKKDRRSSSYENSLNKSNNDNDNNNKQSSHNRRRYHPNRRRRTPCELKQIQQQVHRSVQKLKLHTSPINTNTLPIRGRIVDEGTKSYVTRSKSVANLSLNKAYDTLNGSRHYAAVDLENNNYFNDNYNSQPVSAKCLSFGTLIKDCKPSDASNDIYYKTSKQQKSLPKSRDVATCIDRSSFCQDSPSQHIESSSFTSDNIHLSSKDNGHRKSFCESVSANNICVGSSVKRRSQFHSLDTESTNFKLEPHQTVPVIQSRKTSIDSNNEISVASSSNSTSTTNTTISSSSSSSTQPSVASIRAMNSSQRSQSIKDTLEFAGDVTRICPKQLDNLENLPPKVASSFDKAKQAFELSSAGEMKTNSRSKPAPPKKPPLLASKVAAAAASLAAAAANSNNKNSINFSLSNTCSTRQQNNNNRQ